MTTPRLIAALSFFIALALPGVINGLNFGRAIAVVLMVPIALLLGTELMRLLARGRVRPPRGLPLSAIVLASGLSLVYAIAGFRALSSTTSTVVDVVGNMMLVNLSELLAVLAGVLHLRRRDHVHLPHSVVISLAIAVAGLMALNLMLMLLGIRHRLINETPQVNEETLLLSLIGLHVHRVLLPVSTGVINSAVVPLAAVLLAIELFRARVLRSLSLLWLAPVGGVLLALNDTRSFLMAAPVALLATSLFRRRPTALAFAAILMPVVPPLITLASGALLPVIQMVATARYDTFGMFSGREYIWGLAFAHWISDFTLSAQLLGNGLYGQVLAGINVYYAEMFGNFSEVGAELASLHNSYLQAVADVGLIGLAMLLLFLFSTMRRFATLSSTNQQGQVAYRAFLSIFFALFVVAGTEVIISPYAREAFCIISIMLITAALTAEHKERIHSNAYRLPRG